MATLPTTRTAMLAYLASIQGKQVISAQQTGSTFAEIASCERLGVTPGMAVCDYYQDAANQFWNPFTMALIAYGKAGGLVGVGAAMCNPVNQTNARDQTNINASQMLTPGTAQNKAFLGECDKMATALKQLIAAGNCPLFRPLNEGIGNWFWWGTINFTAAQFEALWVMMYERITGQGVTNLLWVYSTNPGWPGDAYVDISGYDAYGNDLSQYQQFYSDAMSQHPTKLFALTEWGSGDTSAGNPNFDVRPVFSYLASAMPNVVYINAWSTSWAWPTQQFALAALTGARVINAPIGAAPPPPPPPGGNTVLTPTSGGSVKDAAGNVWTLPLSGVATINGLSVPGGAGTAQLTSVAGVIWAQDVTSKVWFIWANNQWNNQGINVPPGTVTPPPPPPPVTPGPPTHAQINAILAQISQLQASVDQQCGSLIATVKALPVAG